MPISATYQCCQLVPPISASQCRLSVLIISAAYQRQSVPPISASQCHLSVPVSAAYQCRLSGPYISVMYQCHISVLPFSAHQ
ncbi:unnamed protein product [Staurois parvus]|uniref:Uncharacterized protein n=1 Tax=Staurois parvus TaxID=386267 RepID=A0ABN9DRB9_9NEOB|nr:unnamed protein product [Staurois parvus]